MADRPASAVAEARYGQISDIRHRIALLEADSRNIKHGKTSRHKCMEQAGDLRGELAKLLDQPVYQ
jgi:hypothetical protein